MYVQRLLTDAAYIQRRKAFSSVYGGLAHTLLHSGLLFTILQLDLWDVPLTPLQRNIYLHLAKFSVRQYSGSLLLHMINLC